MAYPLRSRIANRSERAILGRMYRPFIAMLEGVSDESSASLNTMQSELEGWDLPASPSHKP